jgi:hypothetical protein
VIDIEQFVFLAWPNYSILWKIGVVFWKTIGTPVEAALLFMANKVLKLLGLLLGGDW